LPSNSILLGNVFTENGDIIRIVENNLIVKDLKLRIIKSTNEYLKKHKHIKDIQDQFYLFNRNPLKINLSNDDDIVGFTTEDYETYSYPGNLDISNNYIVLINNNAANLIYYVDLVSNSIIFEKPIYSEDD
jgi:hypothetical protein